ncbi:hypothetical protein ACGFNY_05130 [Streptomyces chartreusis]|uniref:hypothetical protein n=1 Tax=Streptomyces chartreusis TaxID=1969 RepID=UPI0037158CFC
MGFRPPRKTYTLDFTGTDYDGLEVKVRGFTVGEELELDDAEFSGDLLVKTIASRLISWNVEDEKGEPVPATFEGICTQETAMVLAILDALRRANSGVSAPLPNGSPTGGPTPVVSIPMAPLSESPESSAVPA